MELRKRICGQGNNRNRTCVRSFLLHGPDRFHIQGDHSTILCEFHSITEKIRQNFPNTCSICKNIGILWSFTVYFKLQIIFLPECPSSEYSPTISICYETHQKAKDILEGRKIDPTFYPVIYGADESDDWTDPKVWKKANPSLGITVGIDKVKAACESAKQNPGEENSFRQLRLNQVWMHRKSTTKTTSPPVMTGPLQGSTLTKVSPAPRLIKGQCSCD